MAARTVSRISLGTAAKACSEQAAWISRAAEASNMVFCCKLAATAAPAALYDVPLLGGKPGGEHIVDLAGDAPQVAGQLVALDFRRAVFLV